MKSIPFKTLSFFVICTITCFFLSCQGDTKSNKNTESDPSPEEQIQATPPIKESKEIFISYEGPHALITVENNLLNHTQIKQMFVKGSVSAKPDSIARIQMATDMLLSPKKLELLENAIVTSGFMGLEDAYGAPKEKRNYPTTIKVKYNGKTKAVIFRSNPSFDKAPISFKRVQAALMSLHKTAVAND